MLRRALLTCFLVALTGFAASGEEKQKGEPFVLPEGHKAVPLKISSISVAEASIAPGSKVDVILVQKSTVKLLTSKVLQDVLVVAVDVTPKKKDKVETNEHTFTLALKEDDAKKLADAEKKGRLTLVLRGPKSDK